MNPWKVAMSALSREVAYDRDRALLAWLNLRDWMLLCLELEVGEHQVAAMQTEESGQAPGKVFLTDRRLICTRLTAEGVYLPFHARALASVDRVVTLPAESILLLLSSPQHLDLIVRACAPKVCASEFERFAQLVRDTVSACGHP
jgi:hypothetical protein